MLAANNNQQEKADSIKVKILFSIMPVFNMFDLVPYRFDQRR